LLNNIVSQDYVTDIIGIGNKT